MTPSRKPPRPMRRGRPKAVAAASSTISPAGMRSTRSRSIEKRCAKASAGSAASTCNARCSESASSTGADQPPQRRGAPADRDGGVHRRQREPLEDAVGVLAHRVQLCRRRRVGAAVAVGQQPRADAERLRPRRARRERADRQLGGAAANVDHADAARERLAERARGAEERQPRLLRPVEHLDLDAAVGAQHGGELGGVGGAADRRGGHHPHRATQPISSTSARCSVTTAARPRRSSRAGSRRPSGLCRCG